MQPTFQEAETSFKEASIPNTAIHLMAPHTTTLLAAVANGRHKKKNNIACDLRNHFNALEQAVLDPLSLTFTRCLKCFLG